MQYVLLGHASETLGESMNKIPPGCMLLLAEECGVQGTFPHTLYKVFSNPDNAPLFQDPVNHHRTLETLLKKPLRIFTEGEQYPTLSYNFLNVNAQNDMEPSGLYALPADEATWAKEPQRTGFRRYAVTVKPTENIQRFYDRAVFPKITEPTTLLEAHENKASVLHATQNELFQRYPGIYFNLLCRSVKEQEEEIRKHIRKEFPKDPILEKDPYNRVVLYEDWLVRARRRTLTHQQTQALDRIQALVSQIRKERRQTETNTIDDLISLLHADRISSRTRQRIQALPLTDLAKPDSHDGTTVLSAAAEHGHLTIVHDLLHRGAPVNITDSDGVTPLILACSNSHGRVALALLEGGASPTVADDDGVTALHVSAQNQELVPVVKTLLVLGADPNALDKEGDTPVHVAAAHNMTTILRLLLKHGGSTHIRNQEGRTPLLEALHDSNEQAAAVLLPHSDLTQTSKHKQSALSLTLNKGFEDLALRMIQSGCPVRDWAKLEDFAAKSKMTKLAQYVLALRKGLGFVPNEVKVGDRKRMVRCLQTNKEWLQTKKCAKPCPSGQRTKTLRCKKPQ